MAAQAPTLVLSHLMYPQPDSFLREWDDLSKGCPPNPFSLEVRRETCGQESQRQWEIGLLERRGHITAYRVERKMGYGCSTGLGFPLTKMGWSLRPAASCSSAQGTLASQGTWWEGDPRPAPVDPGPSST